MKSIKIISLVLVLFISFAYSQRSDDKGERWDTDNVLTLIGTVTGIDHPLAEFKSDDGNTYQIHMGPYWYWKDNNYELKKDIKIQVKGEVKGSELYPWEIEQDGSKMYFADDNGVPKWSGSNNNGWKKGNGYKGNGRGKCWK